MSKILVVLVSIATLTTGCASMSTKRPSGGSNITKTTSPTDPAAHVETFDQRADLGER